MLFVALGLMIVTLLGGEFGGSAQPVDAPPFEYVRVDASALPDGITDRDVLYTARTAWSESDRPDERRLVLWTIRNRVDERHDGDSTYIQVVLARRQFSGWDIPKARDRMLALHLNTPDSAWQETIDMTIQVMAAHPDDNPIPGVDQFYSPVSMDPPGRRPSWAVGRIPKIIIPGLGLARFHFYSS